MIVLCVLLLGLWFEKFSLLSFIRDLVCVFCPPFLLSDLRLLFSFLLTKCHSFYADDDTCASNFKKILLQSSRSTKCGMINIQQLLTR
jgi:hypothetical protein